MPGGLSLGGAFFTLYGDNAQILQTMAEARQATLVATKAMADAQTAYAEAAKATSTASRAAWKAIGDSYVADAQRASVSIKQLSGVLDSYGVSVKNAGKSTEGLSASLKGIGATVATLSGFGAIASGVLVVREAFLALKQSTDDLNEAQFRLQKNFGDLTPLMAQQAKALQAYTGGSLAEATQGVANFAAIQRNFGLSTEQVMRVQQVAADAAAAQGLSLADAAHRVATSLTGETESSEVLGFSLQQNYLRALKDVNSEEYKRFQSMGPTQQAQTILNEVFNQSNQYAGAAAEKAQSAVGATERLGQAFGNLAGVLGQQTNPAVAGLLNGLTGYINKAAEAAASTGKINEAASKVLQQAGIPKWLADTAAALSSVDLSGYASVKAELARAQAEEDAKTARARAEADAQAEHKRLVDQTNFDTKVISDLKKQATQRDVAAENEAYADKKAALEVDKTARIKAAEDAKKAALEGIAAEKQGAEDLYQARRAHLEALKQAELQAAEDRHTAATRALAAEKDAVEEAEKLQVRGIEATRDAALKAGDRRKEAELDALEAVKRERDAARVEEDRALADGTEAVQRAAQDRHTAITRGLEAEAVAIRHNAEEENRALAETAKKAEEHHKGRLAQIEARGKAAEKGHADALRRIETEGKAADEAHRLALAGIEAEATAAKNGHDQQVRAIDDQLTAAKRLHDDRKQALSDELAAATHLHDQRNRDLADQVAAAQGLHDVRNRALADEVSAAQGVHDIQARSLSDQLDAATRVHDLRNRGLEDQLAAATAVHAAIIDGLDAEKSAAQSLHEQAVRNLADRLDRAQALHAEEAEALDARSRSEDARHTQAMANLAAEEKGQNDQIDAQLRLLDDAARSDTHTSRLADLKAALGVAQSSGNSATIAKAERDLAQETADFERAQLRETLQAAKQNVKDRIDTEQDLAKAQHDQIDAEIDDEKRLSDARLAATKTATDAGKQLADDTLARTTAGIAAGKDAADRELDLIRQTVSAQKQAGDDALALIKARVDAAKQANDDTLAAIKKQADTQKQANDDALALIKAQADAAKTANDDVLTQVKDRIDARQAELDDALTKLERESTDRKQALADELARIQTQLAARKDQATEELRLTKVTLDARKLAADDEYTSRKDSLDKQKIAADLGYDKDKDRIDRRKQDVKDETDDLLIQLDGRKKGEEARYLAEQRANQDTHDAALRNLQDRRTAEDNADRDRRTQVERAHAAEQLLIKETAELAILASKDALAQYQADAALRKTAADDLYHHEQDQIHATYDHPETGLLPKLKAAFDDTKKWYDARTLEVNKQYDNERTEIAKTFDDKETGLFARLADVHQKTIDALQHTREDWEKNFQKPIEEVTQRTLATADAAFAAFFAKHGRVSINSESDGTGGRQGGPGGDGPGPVPGGIPSPYRVTFPYDAPYNGPFAGGAMWAGGPTRHQGIDLALPGPNNGMGKPYGAFQPGTVYWKGYEPAGGNGMIIKTDDGLYNYYGHSQRFLVGTGQHVEAGQEIGILGESGTEGSPHLHYAVRTEVNSGHIDPVPYMTGGGHAGDDDPSPKPGTGVEIKDGYLVFTLFGEQYKIKLPAFGGATGGELLEAIQHLGQEIADKSFGRAAAAVADSEGATGDLRRPGAGGARGPFQFDPGGELPNYAEFLGTSVDEAGTHAGRFPLDAARYALAGGRDGAGFSGEGYLGRAIKAGQHLGLEGPELAEYASRYGQRPHGDLWRRAGESYRKLYGYAHGGVIPEPTLLVGQTLGPYAMAGENAPEWVTPQAPSTARAPVHHTSVEMAIMIGNREVERLWIDGYHLNVQRGRQFGSLTP